VSFESTRVPGIHVVGDACNAAPMPKSAFAANSQAKAAAYNVAALLAGRSPSPSVQMNACYSFVTDQEAISVSAVYRVEGGKLETVPRTFATSKAASRAEARFAESWFNSIRADAFG
jgi:sulfide dehydrogenase [flavocytochrome c] flavoprotein subunit